MLTCEIIAIGTELLTPDKSDTNSLWLTEKLNQIGIEVKQKTIVGDDGARLEEAIADALKRSNLLITTGGLGPTEDDITRQISARAIKRELVFDEEVAREIAAKFQRMNREMPEINKRQAFVIEGADVLPNPNGTAPGLMLDVNSSDRKAVETTVIILPGPPRELKPMFENFVLPKLRLRAGEVFASRRILRVSGMGESAVDEKVAPIYTKFPDIETTILFNRSEVELHLTARSANFSENEKMLDKVSEQISEALGIALFSTDGARMEEVVGRILAGKERTLAIAESCTGGLISQRITEVSGSSGYFIEGAVTYSNDAKIRTLNVPKELIEQHGAVSAEVAEAMAKGIRVRAKTDYGISVTGIAGPTGGSESKPVGLVFVGYSDQSQTKSFKIILPGDRNLIRWRASQAALDYLRRQLLKTN